MTLDLKTHLAMQTERIEVRLDDLLRGSDLINWIKRPPRLLAAMRYGVLNGGKRLRPLLILECTALLGRVDKGVLDAACALELIHCYSLVHDDLPAMDDDDLRRGRPTVHRVYDEATAILAGDALLTLAFDIIADEAVHPDAAVRLRVSRELSKAAGSNGMVGGQMLDLQAEYSDKTEVEIREFQAMKTGSLLRYACQTGAILANATDDDISRLTQFGETIGIAFQIVDDLLDIVASPKEVGKATGKDKKAGKATLVGLWGIKRSRRELNRLLVDAEGLLAPFGARAETLNAIASYITNRSC
ncbi:polyprenyl synthetase family protein [uncultured Ruegeria sp.]|uniref:polyprenyl synthetase family protein n=1 Tax=uncultured Ruegeria sp. TaxID=259304 RepID=UPI00261FE4A5|nr:farnesyl diphosphate synthase [uncultured Ruegeria sp.]